VEFCRCNIPNTAGGELPPEYIKVLTPAVSSLGLEYEAFER
jgi:hypothetical protein